MTTLRLLPDLELALTQLPGVRAASVVTGPDAQPTEIHVLAGAGKPAKQLVRDVQSLAMAKYDLDIDHRIVSVVQLEPDEVLGVASPADAPRPVMTTVQLRTTSGETEATVIVSLGDVTFEGSATGPGSVTTRPRLVARATLEAVRELLGTPAEVEHAAIASVGAYSVAVCVVAVVLPRIGEQLLTGSALVRGDEADAAARAVLDALNRRLSG
ncbi:MAG: hypothetical protein QOJ92_1960 [Frankiales bacterium]|jgi:hypothetical protein|nr:hypothetical protein [Frankiales bacterium]MDX6274750.1 hypothetical protein [Frankiales bacterium]